MEKQRGAGGLTLCSVGKQSHQQTGLSETSGAAACQDKMLRPSLLGKGGKKKRSTLADVVLFVFNVALGQEQPQNSPE